MNYTIIWSPDALSSFDDRIQYLKIHWTEKEITNFKARVKKYLVTLAEEPLIGKRPGKHKNLHMGLIIKPVSLIYRVNKIRKEIELVLFIDNRQDPRKIKKYKA
jgi:plasmid stabilization system protein ParE